MINYHPTKMVRHEDEPTATSPSVPLLAQHLLRYVGNKKEGLKKYIFSWPRGTRPPE